MKSSIKFLLKLNKHLLKSWEYLFTDVLSVVTHVLYSMSTVKLQTT